MRNMRQKTRGCEWTLGAILTMLLLLALMGPTAAMAQQAGSDQVRLAVQPGLSGMYKVNFPTGVNITIANQGAAFKGLLVVERDKSEHESPEPNQSMRYQKLVQVPAGGLVQTGLMVPGQLINAGAVVTLLVDGTPVAQSYIQGTAVSSGVIALSLSEKPLKGGIASWLDQTFTGQTAIKFLAPDHLPEDPLELGLVDVIIVDDQAVAKLSDKQLKTLKDWVSLGGMLLISGGAGTYSGGALADISPVTAEGQRVVAADLGGLRLVKGTVSVTTGRLTKGQVLAQVNGVIVVASRQLGQGQVVFCGIPLEQLTAESTAVWPLVFGKTKEGRLAFTDHTEKYMAGDILSQAAGYLPQLKMPPVPRVAVIWFIYVLVVGPGLYLILKRRDRRDWLWWLIPSAALLTTLVVYLMSPAQRIHAPISQTLAVVDILDKHLAEVNATGAFVSPYGGTLNVQGPARSIILSNDYQMGPNKSAPIIQYGDRPNLSFQNVEYWSMRQARAIAVKNNLGQIEGQLTLDNGTIRGRISNHTTMKLRDCQIMVGAGSIALGKIDAGDSIEVNQAINNWPVSLGPNDVRNGLVPPIAPGQRDEYVRERQMVEVALGPMQRNMNSDDVIFLGWSDDSLDLFQILSGEPVKDYSLALVKQNLRLDIAPGKAVKLPPGMLIPQIIDSRGAFERNAAGYTVFEGKVTFSINLDRPFRDKAVRVVELEFPGRENKNFSLRYFDWQENNWVDLPGSGLKIGSDQLQRYRSPNGEFRLQVEKVSGLGQPDRILMPAVTVEGVVSQ